MDEEVDFGPTIQPICLAQPEQKFTGLETSHKSIFLNPLYV